MTESVDVLGKKYNRLTVIEFVGKKDGAFFYKCLCDCGKEKTARKGDIVCNKVKSCGCLNAEIKKNRKHNGLW